MHTLILTLLALGASSALAKPGVSVTVYNDNLALVRDIRDIEYKNGTDQLLFRDVAAQIDQSSVHFKANGVTLFEQNFDFDLVSPEKLRENFIDQQIEVVTEKGDLISGTLLTSSTGFVVLKSNDGILRSLHTGKLLEIRYPELPDGLITRPTLRWLVNSPGGRRETEVSYLTGGMNWNADYICVINGSNKADLAAWVTLNNTSGASYMSAKLKLMAGEVHRAQPSRPKYNDFARTEMLMVADGGSQFSERSFFEYHLYTLERPTDVLDNQTKQVSLFPNAHVQTKRIYEYDHQRNDERVSVSLEFLNSKDNELGVPLPAGRVRVFQEDTDGSQEFIGEDNIEHTPRDEKVRVTIGNAFDIAVERAQKDYRQISDRVYEQDIEVKLRNRKTESVNIVVVDHSWGEWEITKSSLPLRKVSASKFEFDVAAAPDKEVVLTYTIRNR